MLRRLGRSGLLDGPAGVLFLALLAGFAGLGAAVHAEAGPVTRLDLGLGEELRDHRDASPLARQVFLAVTGLGSAATLTAVVAAAAVGSLWARRRSLAALWVIADLGAWGLITGLKDLFGRHRPPFLDPGVVERSLSFPSGHALGSIVVYGLLAALLARHAARPWLRRAALVLLGGLILAIAFSRVYLGAHYLTDVLGGLCCGGAWLAACLASWNGRKGRRVSPGAVPPPHPAG